MDAATLQYERDEAREKIKVEAVRLIEELIQRMEQGRSGSMGSINNVRTVTYGVEGSEIP